MSLTVLGRTLKALRMIRTYRDGSGFGFVWRWWNPLTWVATPLVVVLSIIMQGVPETWKYKHDIGFGMKPWFIKHPEQLEWLP